MMSMALLFFLTGFVKGQGFTVSGKVTDALDGAGLPGVSISVEGSTVGTASDFEGKYSLTVPSKETVLVFSYVGYLPESKTVGDLTEVNVVLNQDVMSLDELVVIGYGTQKKSNLTGSVAIVDVEDMMKSSNTNVGTMMQGRASGVTVTTDGEPGADPTIRIRGFSTFGDCAPLYVIDGVATEGSMRDLSPNDIESIQVLKDASAAAIYGSRAANGVVIVTTKKGKKNTPLNISYKGYFGADDVWQRIPLLEREDYQTMVNTSLENNGYSLFPGNDPESDDYIDDVNTDWQDEGFKTGTRQNHNLSLMGGGENITYALITDYYDSKGTLVGYGPDYTRYSVRGNSTMQKGCFSAGTSLFYSHSDANTLSETDDIVAGGSSPMVVKLLGSLPTMKAYDDENEDGFGHYDTDIHGENYTINIIGYNSMIENTESVDRTLANGWGQIDLGHIFNWENHNIKLKTLVSYDKTEVHVLQFIPEFSLSDFFTNEVASLYEASKEYTRGLIENTISYNGSIGELNMEAIVGQTYTTYNYYLLEADGTGFSEPYYKTMANATSTSANSWTEDIYMASYLGRISLDYKDRYLLQGSMRRDGSSKFKGENRFGIFPSVSAGWKIHEEEWFPVVDDRIVSELKLRAGWGILGNSTASDAYSTLATTRANVVYNFNGSVVSGTTEADVVSDLVWEEKEMSNIGLDMAFFDNKITGSVEYYNSVTHDVILELAIPQSVGSVDVAPYANAATLKNSGLDINLSYRSYVNDFKYEVYGNLATLKNEVVKLNEQGASSINGTCITVVGEEVGQLYGYRYDGLFQTEAEVDAAPFQNALTGPGDIKYKDLDGDGTITTDDREVLGSGIPDFTYGIGFNCEWKGIDFSMFGNGAAGFMVYDNLYATLMHSGGGANWHEDILDAWTETNTNTDIPRVIYDDPNGNANISDRPGLLQKGDYFRISNITLGYSLPSSLLDQVNISKARVYATVQNLYTFTQYKGYNPDFNNPDPFYAGYNYGGYPLSRTFMFGVNLDF